MCDDAVASIEPFWYRNRCLVELLMSTDGQLLLMARAVDYDIK